jgi:glutamate racemase
LAYLEPARRLLPTERFVYLADNAHFPYGDQSAERVREYVLEAIGAAVRRLNPKAIVLACNTASVAALAVLRSKFEIPFIGTVPAVKPAAESTRTGRFSVLATEGTLQGAYLKDLIDRYAGGCRVTLVAAGPLVRFVETRGPDGVSTAEKTRLVRTALEGVGSSDSVVLACTHFLHLEDEFRSVLGDRVRIIDSRNGVVQQLRRVLDGAAALEESVYCGPHLLFVSEHAARYEAHARRFELEYAGVLEMVR